MKLVIHEFIDLNELVSRRKVFKSMENELKAKGSTYCYCGYGSVSVDKKKARKNQVPEEYKGKTCYIFTMQVEISGTDCVLESERIFSEEEYLDNSFEWLYNELANDVVFELNDNLYTIRFHN